jgi:predicted transcriptional regulator
MRVRLSVDVEPELKRRLKVAAASRNVTVKTLIEQALDLALDAESPEDATPDRAWLESDLSRLGEYEPYDWQEGELDEGEPLIVEHAGGG